jgi:hypothetical protein
MRLWQHSALTEHGMCWLQVILIPAVNGYAKNSLSSLPMVIFMTNIYLKWSLKLHYSNIVCYDWIKNVQNVVHIYMQGWKKIMETQRNWGIVYLSWLH